MKRTLLLIFIVVVGVLGLFGVKYFYRDYRYRQEIDRVTDAILLQNPQVMLDCSPLGKLDVTFLTENLTPDEVAKNMPTIVQQWSKIWPSIYLALDKAGKDYNGGDKFGENPNLIVVVPGAPMSTDPEWEIEYNSQGGEYAAQMKGLIVVSAKDAY